MIRGSPARYYLAVVSTGRPESVAAMSSLVGEATWITRPSDSYGDIRVEGLCAARNRALEEAFGSSLPCIQVSDDLRKLEEFEGGKNKRAIGWDSVAETLLDALFLSEAKLAGVAPTANTFYASLSVKRRHFIVGDLIAVEPTTLRFDENLALKEDYDYTCQQIATYGCVARVDWILATFLHRKNPGGAVSYRTPEVEQEAICYLMRKWPGWFRENPKRPNEILLRPPPRG